MGLLAAGGCRRAEPPAFVADPMALVEYQIVPEHERQIAEVMKELFGTPDDPRVPDGVELDIDKLRMAAGAAGYVGTQKEGESAIPRGLYRQHCAQCHGITGDALGPAASVVNARPRDFRVGVFKFKSTWHAAKPTDADLHRTIERGLAGTAMPAFLLLDGDALNREAAENTSRIAALVEYVKYLSLRGEVERELIVAVGDEFDFDPATKSTDDPLDPENDPDDRQLVDDIVQQVAQAWHESSDERVPLDPGAIPPKERDPQELAASIAAGSKLFSSDKAKCSQCHGATGKGDGSLALAGLQEYDDWTQREIHFRRDTLALADRLEQNPGDATATDRAELARRQRVVDSLLPPEKVRPRDLTDGVFRGGAEPRDLFLRIHQGIPGTPMPAHGSPRPGVAGALTDAEIWQLVDYVRSLRQGPAGLASTAAGE